MTFRDRLVKVLKDGRMAQGDLRHWFGRSYSTTASWLRDRREPRGPAGEEAKRRLAILEKLIRQGRGFPVPVDLSLTERPRYIQGLANDHCTRLLEKNTSRRGLQMRNGDQ